jgi:hypothetical protein
MTVGYKAYRSRNTTRHHRGGFGQNSESSGNARLASDIRIPPDDIGNKLEIFDESLEIEDSVGNSLEREPAHLQSGILSEITQMRARLTSRRRAEHSYGNYGSPRIDRQRDLVSAASEAQKGIESGDDYMHKLSQEFSRLLREKAGIAFSFTMRPISDKFLHRREDLGDKLIDIEALIKEILDQSSIEATIECHQYRTAVHHFAVFSVLATETDPLKNKTLIAALRKVVSGHIEKINVENINVFVVLANALPVIEDHLAKIGAEAYFSK